MNLGQTAIDALNGAAAGISGGPVGMVLGLLSGIGGDVLPALIPHLSGPQGKTVAAAVVQAVSTATGAPDPTPANIADLAPDAKADLQVKLATIAAGAEQNRLAAAEAARAAELEALKAGFADTENARDQTVDLARANSAIAWGSVVVSVVIVLAFAAALVVVLTGRLSAADGQIASILIGTLASMATGVANYWLGSSSGSHAKSLMLANSVPAGSQQ